MKLFVDGFKVNFKEMLTYCDGACNGHYKYGMT